MDRVSRCLQCGKRLVPVPGVMNRMELLCIRCNDPIEADKWSRSPLAIPLVDDRPSEPR
jgi:hypothetical protein